MTQAEEVTLLGGDVQNAAPHTGKSFEIDRLGIPAVYYSDGPVGPRQGSATAMPIPLALAATMDQGLAGAHGGEIALEAKAKGNDVLFAPTVNVLRNPQGGRDYEAYGEEPFLIARTAVGWINGAQSKGVLADVKHFSANNQEGQSGVPPLTAVNGSRNAVNAIVDERTLREVYWPHFEAAVKQANVATLMCSYNLVNSQYSCANTHNNLQVLKGDWGFKGIELSDYGANYPEIASCANGLDFEPSGLGPDLTGYNPAQLDADLATGLCTKAQLDEHVHRILRTMFAYGLFDRPAYANDDSQINKAGDAAVAETVEERAITLLKNNGVLPLSPSVKKIAVIGPYADKFVTGGGSGGVSPFSVVTALQGITARAGKGVTVTYADGSDQAAAAAAAKAADVAIVVVGDVRTEGEDRACDDLNCSSDIADSNSILLTGSTNYSATCANTACPLNGNNEDGLVAAVAAAQPKTVAVLETGGPVLTPFRDQVAGLVEAWYPGQTGGTALARVLFGDIDPGGRLPATFEADDSQLPTAGSQADYPGVAEQETYSEGLEVGYRWYDAHNLTPAYPFGAGLSYTSFSYSGLSVAAGGSGADTVATASLTVTNTGKRTGWAVPQLYLSKPSTAALPQPVRELAGVQPVQLAAGQSAVVTYPLNARSFASWDVTRGTAADSTGSWVIPPGCYTVAAGASSRSLPVSVQAGQGQACGGLALATAAPDLASNPLPANPAVRLIDAAVTKSAPAKKTIRKAHPKRVVKHVAQPTRTLAFTGLPSGLGCVALMLLTGGAVVTRRRRRMS